jgi:hypothetical protein
LGISETSMNRFMKRTGKKKHWQFSGMSFDLFHMLWESWLHIRTGYLIFLRTTVMSLENHPDIIWWAILVQFPTPTQHCKFPSWCVRVGLRTSSSPRLDFLNKCRSVRNGSPKKMVSIVKLPARFATEQNLQWNFPEVTKDLKHFTLYFVNWILTLLKSFLRFLKTKSYSQST